MNLLPFRQVLTKVLNTRLGKVDAIPVAIVTDPGVDDALMLLQALSHSKLDVQGVIPVRGNASSKRCLQNTLSLFEQVSRSTIPVYPGRPQKFSGKRIYGYNGLCDYFLPKANMLPQTTSGIEFLCEKLKNNKLLLILTAGLTEPAEVLSELEKNDPTALQNIIALSIIGGVINHGQEANCQHKDLTLTEANFNDNPVATKTVFDIASKNNIPIFLSPLDLTQSILVSTEDVKPLTHTNHPAATIAYNLIKNVPRNYKKRYGKGPDGHFRQPLHDTHSTSSLLHPEIYHGAWSSISFSLKPFKQKIDFDNTTSQNVFLLASIHMQRQKYINFLINDYKNF